MVVYGGGNGGLWLILLGEDDEMEVKEKEPEESGENSEEADSGILGFGC